MIECSILTSCAAVASDLLSFSNQFFSSLCLILASAALPSPSSRPDHSFSLAVILCCSSRRSVLTSSFSMVRVVLCCCRRRSESDTCVKTMILTLQSTKDVSRSPLKFYLDPIRRHIRFSINFEGLIFLFLSRWMHFTGVLELPLNSSIEKCCPNIKVNINTTSHASI